MRGRAQKKKLAQAKQGDGEGFEWTQQMYDLYNVAWNEGYNYAYSEIYGAAAVPAAAYDYSTTYSDDGMASAAVADYSYMYDTAATDAAVPAAYPSDGYWTWDDSINDWLWVSPD